jgi:hypothetical protein
MKTVNSPNSAGANQDPLRLVVLRSRYVHLGGVMTKYRNIGCASISRSAVAAINRPTAICTTPNSLGAKTSVDPSKPKRNPTMVYPRSLKRMNKPTSGILLFIPPEAWDPSPEMAVASKPPCTARQEIPPVVRPVKNASQTIDIAVECVYYIPYRGIEVKEEICRKEFREIHPSNSQYSIV